MFHRAVDAQVIHQCSNRTYPSDPSRPGGVDREVELPGRKQVTSWVQSSHGCKKDVCGADRSQGLSPVWQYQCCVTVFGEHIGKQESTQESTVLASRNRSLVVTAKELKLVLDELRVTHKLGNWIFPGVPDVMEPMWWS